jgi:hypothetical protein
MGIERELEQRIEDLDERVADLEHDVATLRGLRSPNPGDNPAEWASGFRGSPGLVMDPGVARSTPCIIMNMGPGRRPYVFSRGVVGALDEEQQALYCQDGVEERFPSEKQQARMVAMEEGAHTCSEEVKAHPPTEAPDALAVYFSCLGRELRSRGVEL